MLSRDEILSKTKLRRETVNVPEWGGDVLVGEMSGASRDSWEQSLQERDNKGRIINPRAKLVVATVIDENGNKLFNDSDIDAVGRLSNTSLMAICDVAYRVNKLLSDDLDRAEKN